MFCTDRNSVPYSKISIYMHNSSLGEPPHYRVSEIWPSVMDLKKIWKRRKERNNELFRQIWIVWFLNFESSCIYCIRWKGQLYSMKNLKQSQTQTVQFLNLKRKWRNYYQLPELCFSPLFSSLTSLSRTTQKATISNREINYCLQEIKLT